MADLERALQIAVQAHAGQKDKNGAAYIFHPLRVMMRCTSERARMAALLHDVVEDTEWTFEKLAQAVRRSLSRVAANLVADELLAIYFLECRKPLLLEWLDLVGLKHEDGTLADDAPAQPDSAALEAAVQKYRAAGDDPDRELLLRAFAAQSAVSWPALDAILGFKE